MMGRLAAVKTAPPSPMKKPPVSAAKQQSSSSASLPASSDSLQVLAGAPPNFSARQGKRKMGEEPLFPPKFSSVGLTPLPQLRRDEVMKNLLTDDEASVALPRGGLLAVSHQVADYTAEALKLIAWGALHQAEIEKERQDAMAELNSRVRQLEAELAEARRTLAEEELGSQRAHITIEQFQARVEQLEGSIREAKDVAIAEFKSLEMQALVDDQVALEQGKVYTEAMTDAVKMILAKAPDFPLADFAPFCDVEQLASANLPAPAAPPSSAPAEGSSAAEVPPESAPAETQDGPE